MSRRPWKLSFCQLSQLCLLSSWFHFQRNWFDSELIFGFMSKRKRHYKFLWNVLRHFWIVLIYFLGGMYHRTYRVSGPCWFMSPAIKNMKYFPTFINQLYCPVVCMYNHHSKVGVKELFVLIKMRIWLNLIDYSTFF